VTTIVAELIATERGAAAATTAAATMLAIAMIEMTTITITSKPLRSFHSSYVVPSIIIYFSRRLSLHHPE
jgi:hypothetical protein